MMKSIGDILHYNKKASPLMRGAAAGLVVTIANEVLIELFGKEIKPFAQAIYVRGTILNIACLGSTTAQEIKIQESIILNEIRERFGSPFVTAIRCIV